MTGDLEDLVVARRTIGLAKGRVSPGCLSCALGPGLPEPNVCQQFRSGFFVIMSLVDFEHFERGYLLPKGCKDLIDVIDFRAKRKPTICLKPISIAATHTLLSNENLLLSLPVTVGDLASALKQKPFKIIADLMELGVFAAVNQCLGFDAVFQIARRYGYVAEKLA